MYYIIRKTSTSLTVFHFISDSFQALIQYPDMLSAQTAKFVSIPMVYYVRIEYKRADIPSFPAGSAALALAYSTVNP